MRSASIHLERKNKTGSYLQQNKENIGGRKDQIKRIGLLGVLWIPPRLAFHLQGTSISFASLSQCTQLQRLTCFETTMANVEWSAETSWGEEGGGMMSQKGRYRSRKKKKSCS